MRKVFCCFGAGVIAIAAMLAQEIKLGEITGRAEKGAIAVPDFRGAGDAQKFMGTFNQVLWDTLSESGGFRMVPKTSYPLWVPQQPQDWRPEQPGVRPPANELGYRLSDWSGPPVNANYMVFGYTAVQNNQLVLFGHLYNITPNDLANAQVIRKLYFGTLDEAGARKVALDFAADILKQFGITPIANTRIYFVSNRTGNKEIWSMNWDGTDQRPFTQYKTVSTMPNVSPDGTKIAFTSFLRGRPELVIHSTEPNRRLVFVNQNASMNATADFTPDGRSIVFSSTLNGGYAQLYIADINGKNLRRLTSSRSIDVEPKVNPKTGAEIVFVSGRGGPQQIYRMNMDGADVVRLTTGEGEAANPAWHPNGQVIAFAWTRGFEPGNFNIFVMDAASRQLLQLTHGAGRNENPSWGPDGRHIVFSSKRGGGTQIFTMLADGTQVKQLTTAGQNEKPVWGR
jgi:TolB protein